MAVDPSVGVVAYSVAGESPASGGASAGVGAGAGAGADEPVSLIPDWRSFVAGSFSGMCGNFAGYPLDTARVLRQTSNASSSAEVGIVGSLRAIVAKEGVVGMFRGVVAPMAGAMAENSVAFASNEYIKILLGLNDEDVPTAPLSLLFVAGAGTAPAVAMATSPTELLKTVMQVNRSTGSYASTLRLVVADGARPMAITIGAVSTVWREMTFYSTYFTTYEVCKRLWASATGAPNSSAAGPIAQMLSGGVAGSLAWTVSYPWDVIKSRIQATGHLPAEQVNRTIRHTAATLMERHGVQGFYRGLSATLIRAFPVNAITFYAYEVAMAWLKD